MKTFEVSRSPEDKYEMAFARFLEDIGCDSYGYSLETDKYQSCIENDTFTLRPYSWNDDDESDLPNFEYKPLGLQIFWYKYPLRGATSNLPLDMLNWPAILADCADSYNCSDVYKYVDLTNLKVNATIEDIVALCNKAIDKKTASVCVPPCYVSFAHERLSSKDVKVCTVIGFPNGYTTAEAKEEEAYSALANGADEIDMVINITKVKNEGWNYIRSEILNLKRVCGDNILKVIIETCYLTDEEIKKLIDIIAAVGADYVKTSTGFGTAGAKLETVKMMSEYIKSKGYDIKIKASGGIHSEEEAENFIRAGASRIGASSLG